MVTVLSNRFISKNNEKGITICFNAAKLFPLNKKIQWIFENEIIQSGLYTLLLWFLFKVFDVGKTETALQFTISTKVRDKKRQYF